MKFCFLSLLCPLFFLTSCFVKSDHDLKRSFASDMKILSKIPGLTVLKDGDRRLAVSGELQGRIFTSTSRGEKGQSYGWFNRELIRNGNIDHQFNALGGEGRFWFGPEIGNFSIFFDKGKSHTGGNMKISPDLSSLYFRSHQCDNRTLICFAEMEIRNSFGTHFLLDVKRKITLLPEEEYDEQCCHNSEEKMFTSIGFCSETWVTNIGGEAWKKETGLLSIWDIGCMLPSNNTIVILPLNEPIDSLHSYFTETQKNRVSIKDNIAFYRADANYMNKIGISPKICTGTFGSYNPDLNLLTIVSHTLNPDGIYVNNHWKEEQDFDGDAINVFNGEVSQLKGRNWPFFEVESLSDTRELGVGETLYHKQSIYHYEGDLATLDQIARNKLQTSLIEIPFR